MPDDHRNDDASDPFSLRSAARAEADGRLDEWVAEFLASPGSDNEPLAAALGFAERRWAGPVLLPLDQMRKLAGPEEGTGGAASGSADVGEDVLVPIDEDEWEDDIGRMVEQLDDGWDPPPLVVSYRVDGFHLEDGNHRHETMLRAGRTHGWAVVAFDDETERDRFLATRPLRAARF